MINDAWRLLPWLNLRPWLLAGYPSTATCSTHYTVLLITTVEAVLQELFKHRTHLCFASCDKGIRVPHTTSKPVDHLPIASSSLPACGHHSFPPPKFRAQQRHVFQQPASTRGAQHWLGVAMYLPLHLFCPCQCQCQQKGGR